jgi:hypothetical protein
VLVLAAGIDGEELESCSDGLSASVDAMTFAGSSLLEDLRSGMKMTISSSS